MAHNCDQAAAGEGEEIMQQVAEKVKTTTDYQQRIEALIKEASGMNDRGLMREYDRWTQQMLDTVAHNRRVLAGDPEALRAASVHLAMDELKRLADELEHLLFNLQRQVPASREASCQLAAQIRATSRCSRTASRLFKLFEMAQKEGKTLAGALPQQFTFLLRYIQVPSPLVLSYLLGAQALSPYRNDDQTMKWLLSSRIGLDILRNLQGGKEEIANLRASSAPGGTYLLGRMDVYPVNQNVETFTWLWEPVFGFSLCKRLFIRLFELNEAEGDILQQLSYRISGDDPDAIGGSADSDGAAN